jgi:hypothetical protein
MAESFSLKKNGCSLKFSMNGCFFLFFFLLFPNKCRTFADEFDNHIEDDEENIIGNRRHDVVDPAVACPEAMDFAGLH